MQRVTTTFIVCILASIASWGCDMGQQEAPIAPPPMVAPPGQPALPAMAPPGAVPGQPVPQPVPQPGVAAPQPVPQPQPGVAAPQPIPQPQPGIAAPQPVPQPQPGVAAPQPVPQPGVVTPQPGVLAPQPGVAAAPAPPGAPPAPTGDALIDKLNVKKSAIAASFTATSAPVKQTLEKKKNQQDYHVQLPGPPYCHTYIAAGNDNVKNIDLSVVSPLGAVEAKDSTQENTAVVQNHCPTTPGAYKLSVNMPESGGEFAVQVFSK